MTRASSPGRVPQSAPLRRSPAELRQETTAPWPTEMATAGAGAGADADAGAGADRGSARAGVPAGADAEGEVTASAGRLGPTRTPATRGHATPTMKPIAVMTPTLCHAGRSASRDGISTESVASALCAD